MKKEHSNLSRRHSIQSTVKMIYLLNIALHITCISTLLSHTYGWIHSGIQNDFSYGFVWRNPKPVVLYQQQASRREHSSNQLHKLRTRLHLNALDTYENNNNEDDDEHDYEEDENEINEEKLTILNFDDWTTAEFTILNGPKEPSPTLSPNDVAVIIARALQFVDHPQPNFGFHTCFEFFTWECRKTVTARKGGDTISNFCKYGLLSPALQPFMGASTIIVGEETITPAKPPLRGSIASFPILIKTADVLSVRYMSGMDKNGVSLPPEIQMVLRLEQQRRPPMQGCWLVREVLDVRHAFAGDLGNAGVAG